MASFQVLLPIQLNIGCVSDPSHCLPGACLGFWPGRGREGGSCSHCTNLLLGAVGRPKGSHCSSLLYHPFSLRANTAPVPEGNERGLHRSKQSCIFHHPFSFLVSEHAKCLLFCGRKNVLEGGVDKGTLGRTWRTDFWTKHQRRASSQPFNCNINYCSAGLEMGKGNSKV